MVVRRVIIKNLEIGCWEQVIMGLEVIGLVKRWRVMSVLDKISKWVQMSSSVCLK
ncbi:hypothetical protein ZOSMA_486G00050 [Zostera marina]|uniref:Uncharacterized protein n=1 Tax=Zostera marina TaxID=29655 RepID=A0A0K9P1T9_ZOSMR|nr:hypothetical protein ZOSMA_486G00050 [Zostera marina]